MKRKTWLAIPLLLTLVVLSQNLTTPSSAVEFPAIYIEPATVGPNGYGINTEFNISICTDYNGSDIWGWTLTLTYNPLVLEGVEVFNGNLTVNATAPATFRAGTFDNDAGKLFNGTGGYFDVNPVVTPPTNVTFGPGILANVTFRVVGTGDTPITLGIKTKLIGYDGAKFYDIVDARLMPYNIGHGYFRNTAYDVVHDAAVLSGNVSEVLNTTVYPDTSLYMGKSVSINVTVKNEGNVTERFDVSIYYRVISPDWLVYNTTVTLPKETPQTIPVVWDTANVYVGNGTITVVVSEVWNETDTTDNQLVIDAVHVRILGDTDANRKVDSDDFGAIIAVYPDPNPPPANIECDLDNDGKIDVDDVVALVGNLGKSE